jgi:hypothetical protein
MEYVNIIFFYLCISWFILFIALFIDLSLENFKPYKPKFNLDFYTDFPSDINIFDLSNLMYKKIMPSVLSAEIVKLFNLALLKLDNIDGEDYISVGNIDSSKITIGQKYTIKLLIDIIGDGTKVSISNIYKFCERKKNCDAFLMEYTIWGRIMRKENCTQIYYESKNQYGMVKFITVFGCSLFIANILGKFRIAIGYVTLLPAVFILLYFIKIYKRTKNANEDYHKWLAFKQYLINIDNFEYNITDPDKYILYGTLLGVKGLEKKLTNHDHFDRISVAINRCVVRAILNGNRKLF